jgi:hypothetical protein
MSFIFKSIISISAYIFESVVQNIGPFQTVGFGDFINNELQTNYYDSVLINIEKTTVNKFYGFIDSISNKVSIVYYKKNDQTKESIHFEECSICMEKMANTKTSCNHWICIDCWNQLDASKIGEHVKCPFCRQEISEIKLY